MRKPPVNVLEKELKTRNGENTKNSTKVYRYRYFLLQIEAEGDPKLYAVFTEAENIKLIFEKTKFVTQQVLEEILHTLKIESGEKAIYLKKYHVQLHGANLDHPPCWKVYCETSAPTTGASVARALSEKLFPLNFLKKIDPRIKIWTRNKLEEFDYHQRLQLQDSDWYPGYFDNKILSFLEIFEKQHLLEDFLLAIARRRPQIKNLLVKIGTILLN